QVPSWSATDVDQARQRFMKAVLPRDESLTLKQKHPLPNRLIRIDNRINALIERREHLVKFRVWVYFDGRAAASIACVEKVLAHLCNSNRCLISKLCAKTWKLMSVKVMVPA